MKKRIKKSLFLAPTLMLFVAPLVVASCGESKKSMTANEVIKKIESNSKEKAVLYIGSTACPSCRMFVSGEKAYKENGKVYDAVNMEDHKGDVGYVSKKGVWGQFLAKHPKNITIYQIEDIADRNHNLPNAYPRKNDDNDASAKEINTILFYLKKHYGITPGTPTVVYFSKGRLTELSGETLYNYDTFIRKVSELSK
ncbi:hypothetical protein [Mycoplasma marinum]|uniref:Thioredoxin-like fold domain-containing protein n=1 Tax=Mycoplasma marinum TaxID=1937190 RepID=A0A4R0XIU4_9MOLU|nr:hypothetical protein [Mycoplasma marinum]TCG10334.1 hypothetical protein C4B24_04790 [Mycoplasma marinum]